MKEFPESHKLAVLVSHLGCPEFNHPGNLLLMRRGQSYRTTRTIEDNFTASQIPKVWDELGSRFGFDVKLWKKRFSEELSKEPRSVEEVHFFLRFCNDHINPILNGILCRSWGYPTFNRFVEYVLNKGK